MQKYGDVLDLLSMADYSGHMTAHCEECMKQGKITKAPFTKRLIESDQVTVIGGDGICREHHACK